MDWIADFLLNFSSDKDFNELKKNNFCGSITLNFNGGKVLSCDFKQHKSFSMSTPNSFSFKSFEQVSRKVAK